MSDIQGVKHQNYHKLYELNYIAIGIGDLIASILVIGTLPNTLLAYRYIPTL